MVRPSSRGGVPVFRRVQFKPERAELIAEQLRRSLAVAAATIRHLADMGQAVQERPGGDDDGAGLDGAAIAQLDAGDAPIRSPTISAATSACLMRRFGSFSSTSRMRMRYSFLSTARAATRRPDRGWY